MPTIRLLLAGLLCVVPVFDSASAPNSPNDLAHLLEKKTVLLRGAFAEDNLAFDAAGNLKGSGTPGPLWLSAISIDHVSFKDPYLVIKGHRMLLLSIGKLDPPATSDIRVVPVALEEVKIVLECDHTPRRVGTGGAEDFCSQHRHPAHGQNGRRTPGSIDCLSIASTPTGYQRHKGTAADSEQTGTAPMIYTPGGSVTPPRVLISKSPLYPDSAKAKHLQGKIVLALVVDKSGMPTRIRVRKSLDSDLDQSAIVALSQYRFAPAMTRGKPVNAEVNVEINLRIY